MKYLLGALLCFMLIGNSQGQDNKPYVISSDIENFWIAFDKIIQTEDTLAKYSYLKRDFLDKGSPGLQSMMEKKGYTADSYLYAIQQYPLFWRSIRENTFKSSTYAEKIEAEIIKLKKLYPELKPAQIYFTIGALMSGGTTQNGQVLIGAEIAMADSSVVSSEFPDWFRGSLRTYFDSNPIEDLVLLNVHEYVHTQQDPDGGYDLLSQCLYEGVAEFVSVLSSGKASATPAIAYGKNNEKWIRERFAQQMFSPNWNDWLYNNFENEFEMRDLGYYVGYAISEKYYEQAIDKKQAIKTLIELNYGDTASVESFVDKTGYFLKSVHELKQMYEKNRPQLIGIHPFSNGSQAVNPDFTQISFTFSTKMDGRFGGFDYGPLGEDHAIPINKYLGLSDDGKSMVYRMKLAPGQRYQRILMPAFRSAAGIAIEPVLVDFRTAEK